MVDLLPGEQVIVGMRKHWLIFLFQTAGVFFGGIIPFLLMPIYKSIFAGAYGALGEDRFESLVLFFLAFWLLILVCGFFIVLTGYYLDILIVTNQRLIDVDQVSLFSRDITVAPLEKVEDVKVQTFGIIATMFKFGNIAIQTAAEEREMIIKGLRYPEYARDVIMKAYEAHLKKSRS